MADTETVERTEDLGEEGPARTVKLWLAEVKSYEKTFKGWSERAAGVIRRYRLEQADQNQDGTSSAPPRFNILWSNIQTMQPAIFGRVPKPDVRRRYRDKDPVGRAAATLLERCLEEEIETSDYEGALRGTRDDYLLTARGVPWVRYVPTYGEETKDKIFLQAVEGEEGRYQTEDGGPVDQTPLMDDDGQAYLEGDAYRPVVSECVKVDHVVWSDFGHTPAPKWSKVRAVWKRELLTRDQLIDRFGDEKGKAVGLTKTVANVDENDVKAYGDAFKRGEVYEIWDKTSRKVIWVSPGYTQGTLDEKDDPLKLSGFFPCPKPLYGTITTDSLVPVPDYTQYKSQADQIDELTRRISILLKALKIAGAYDSSVGDALERIFDSPDNKLIPVDNWAMFAEKGGVQGIISFLPIKEVGEVIANLLQAREQLKRDLYEITGLSDILRGDSDPRETLGAQRIKGQYAGVRLKDRQGDMERLARDTLAIMGEIVAEHFSPENIAQISGWDQTDEYAQLTKAHTAWQQQVQAMAQQGQQIPPGSEGPPHPDEVFAGAVQLLRTDDPRRFRIDIETDSMVFEDEALEKQSRVEFVEASSQFLTLAIPAVQQSPFLAPLLSEMLMFAVRGFKTGRSLEAAFEQLVEQMADQPAQAPQGDGAEAAAAQAEQAKMQIEQQRLQLEQQKMQSDQQQAQAKIAGEQQAKSTQLEIDKMKLQMEEAARQRQHEIAMAKLNVDLINAQADADDREAKRAFEHEKLAIERQRLDDDRDVRREQAEAQAKQAEQTEGAK